MPVCAETKNGKAYPSFPDILRTVFINKVYAPTLSKWNSNTTTSCTLILQWSYITWWGLKLDLQYHNDLSLCVCVCPFNFGAK